MIIACITCYRKNNPVYSHQLEKMFNVSGTVIRDAVKLARRAGVPICNDNGYYKASCYEEWKPTADNLKSRALSMLETIRLFEKYFGINTNNQESLF